MGSERRGGERVAVAEDEPETRARIVEALAGEGYDAEPLERGEDVLGAIAESAFDAVVLDIDRRGSSGVALVRSARAAIPAPILVVSERSSEADRVLGLEAGADDYVTKPFSVTELVSRVRALLRGRRLEREARQRPLRRVGELRIDFARHQVGVDGQTVHLTRSEFQILALLAERPGQVFTRRQIMEHLWETPYVGDDHACEVHVSNLRRKLERDPHHPELIRTVRGVGYKLVE